MVRRPVVLLVIAAGLCSAAAICLSPSTPVVAIASGPELSLYDASGNVVRRVDLKHPVAGFAFSPDRSKLVIVSPDTEHGGGLILIDLSTGSRRTLTGRHFAFEHLAEGEAEVYDSPAFSPDGRNLVFAVHGNLPGDGNDAWENSGPLAVLNLDGGSPRVLKATNHIPGEGEDGPCSEGDPQWSPDGKWILFNCEDGAFVTDPQGKTIRDLKLSSENAGSNAVGWVGDSCVLYVQTPESNGHFDFEHESLKLLNLATGRSISAAHLLTGMPSSPGGLVQASDEAIIRSDWYKSQLTVATRKKQWTLKINQHGPQTGAAKLLSGWSVSSVPPECR